MFQDRVLKISLHLAIKVEANGWPLKVLTLVLTLLIRLTLVTRLTLLIRAAKLWLSVELHAGPP